ncbi:MAG: Glu-tRNA(Gln) amidotransferase subunit GatE [archaeon]
MEQELKAGIEIHQQLDTSKLFCSCPSLIRQDDPDFTVERRLHAVAGEKGEVDKAVKHEASKEKEFTYQSYYDNCCLVELDEEPPHQINQEALDIVLQVALLLNAEIIPYTQIMRKTIIDGSNTGGFQRTVLVAKNGFLQTDEGKVGIQSIALEEDSARIISKEEDKTIFRLDRLGIPLIEVATAPDIKSARQAREVALHLGEILRATKVKRGIGTIRQDVNMSIKGGKRIEIKGVQEPALIEKTILIETERQKKLIKKKQSEAEVRKALKDGKTEFLRPLPGAARMYPETDLPLLHISRNIINDAKAKLPKLKSEIRDELKNKGLSDELMNILLKAGKLEEFNELMVVRKNPNLIVKLLVLWPAELSKKIAKPRKITIDIIESILQAVDKKQVSENDSKEVLEDVINGKDIKEALKKEKIDNLEEEVLRIIKKKPGLSEKAYMGLVMKEFKGKVNGKEVMEILKKLLK